MTPTQQTWLEGITSRIPGLFDLITKGNVMASAIIGTRVINGRTVQLRLVAEVVDPGPNPLRSHASVNYPTGTTPK